MKRVLSVLLICALLMAGLTSFASAEAASIAISVDKTSYAVGDIVTATVKLNDYIENTWSLMTVAVRYDHTVLQYENATNKLTGDYTGGLQPSNDAENGVLGLTWIGDALPAPGADNAVAEVTFTVLKAPESPIQLTAFFVEDGMALQGEKTPMENSSGGEPIYSTGEILSDSITIQPEGTDDPEEPTSNMQTINSNIEPYNTVNFNIAASYKEGGTVSVYQVDIAWNNGDIKYTAEGMEWFPSEHEWVPIGTTETAAKWEGNGTIELYNHSNEAVNATFKYNPVGNNTVMEFKQGTTVIDENGISIAAPQETKENEPISDPGYAKVTATITSGKIEGEEETIELGTLVVTIA